MIAYAVKFAIVFPMMLCEHTNVCMYGCMCGYISDFSKACMYDPIRDLIHCWIPFTIACVIAYVIVFTVGCWMQTRI